MAQPAHTASRAGRVASIQPWHTEALAGLATYLTASYVFLLNPLLLSRTGLDISAAFFATVVSAALATFVMGAWADLPFVVAPAPSITTFFVSYVCLTLGLSWQQAMGAVIVSGLLSVAMAWLSWRGKLIDQSPAPLQEGVLLALSGFLFVNGLVQAKVLSYADGWLSLSSLQWAKVGSPGALVLVVGLCVTLVFRLKRLRFSGAPLLGILSATMAAAALGIVSRNQATLSTKMFLGVGQFDMSAFARWEFVLSLIVFFVIDFFGGVGKYLGLLAIIADEDRDRVGRALPRALYVDGFGNIIGGVLGASSLAVFVSSAVGVVAGGRTGRTAMFASLFMILSLFFIPLVGTIPIEATAGVLVYVGLLLLPYGRIRKQGLTWDVAVSLVAFALAVATYAIDKAILVVFLWHSAKLIVTGRANEFKLLITVTLLLLAAVIMQQVL